MSMADAAADIPLFQNIIAGKRVGTTKAAFQSYDPYTGKPWALIPACTPSDVDAAVAAARRAFYDPAWRGLTPTARGKLLVRLGDLIAQNAERLALLEVRDNGKLYSEMLGQLRYLPEWYRYFGG
ncbi:MAG: aldehyde dehydrogenase family protein, partial [Amphiplicatus sp.]|nr:aldehyde dehydrogenase family protein [Amphiplicatus sp.]